MYLDLKFYPEKLRGSASQNFFIEFASGGVFLRWHVCMLWSEPNQTEPNRCLRGGVCSHCSGVSHAVLVYSQLSPSRFLNVFLTAIVADEALC